MCDDAVDEHAPAEARSLLARAGAVLEDAFGPRQASAQDPVTPALADAVRRFDLPREAFAAILRGMQMDLERRTYETFAELEEYCRCVAGAVGRLCLGVFGYSDPAAVPLAEDMGTALQLTNILRDLKEDVARGRIYLPRAEMEAAGYLPEDLRALRRTPAFARLMTEQVARAHAYYDRSERLFPLVSADARLCPMALHAIYRELLTCIEASGYNVFGPRLRVSTARKLQLVGGLLVRQRREMAGRAQRAGGRSPSGPA